MKAIRILFVLIFIAGLGFLPAQRVSAQALTFTSCMQVQNLGNATANISIDYYPDGGGALINFSDTVTALGSKTYCPLSGITGSFSGSAVISSDQLLATIANITAGNWNAFDGSFSGVSAGATTLNMPLLMKANFGYNTRYTVQNAGSATAHISVTYSDATTASITLEPGYSQTVDQATESHAAGWFGSATITADQPIAGVVLEIGPTILFAYNAFSPTDTSTNPTFPIVSANNFNYNTGVQIQNTAASGSTDVTVSYIHTLSGTDCTQHITINGQQSATFALHAWEAADPNTDNTCVNGETFVGYAKVTTNTTSAPLVGIANQANFKTNKGAAAPSFNPANATGSVVFPLIMDRNFGYFTAFNLVNVGTVPVNILCTYTGTSVTQTATGLAAGAAVTLQQLNTIANAYVGSGTCVATAASGTPQIIGFLNQLKNAGNTDTFLGYKGFNN